jgi:hypothetical protein
MGAVDKATSCTLACRHNKIQDTTSRRTEALPSPKSECAIFCLQTRTAARFQGLSAAAQPFVSKLQSPIFTGITGGPQGPRANHKTST